MDRTYRLPHQPSVRVRTLGPREFTQVPPRELAAVLTVAGATGADGTRAARAAGAHYGVARLGRTVLGRIEAVRTLVEPGSGGPHTR